MGRRDHITSFRDANGEVVILKTVIDRWGMIWINN